MGISQNILREIKEDGDIFEPTDIKKILHEIELQEALDYIVQLTKSTPNDQELGSKIRELI